eukprot:gnl/TRDRNA2_/TRDRNA2_132288_c0_seq1.p1 gnl/TRDRNA2_/TRDRNA2_132288_c0~~gnl/TRDRNA2_/TRDRNA2_132288_c0_seq1.p1  ORF type:complete len:604 (+),score=100.50 gnl/TRDRNA2_/TRDRNA2_132288_c0_seq1:883-2694(+)
MTGLHRRPVVVFLQSPADIDAELTRQGGGSRSYLRQVATGSRENIPAGACERKPAGQVADFVWVQQHEPVQSLSAPLLPRTSLDKPSHTDTAPAPATVSLARRNALQDIVNMPSMLETADGKKRCISPEATKEYEAGPRCANAQEDSALAAARAPSPEGFCLKDCCPITGSSSCGSVSPVSPNMSDDATTWCTEAFSEEAESPCPPTTPPPDLTSPLLRSVSPVSSSSDCSSELKLGMSPLQFRQPDTSAPCMQSLPSLPSLRLSDAWDSEPDSVCVHENVDNGDADQDSPTRSADLPGGLLQAAGAGQPDEVADGLKPPQAPQDLAASRIAPAPPSLAEGSERINLADPLEVASSERDSSDIQWPRSSELRDAHDAAQDADAADNTTAAQLEASTASAALDVDAIDTADVVGESEVALEEIKEEDHDNELRVLVYRESIPREQTVLHQLYQEDCLRRVDIIVPDGVGEDRTVRVEHFNRKWFFQIPEGASLGDSVTVFLPAVPPLDSKKRKHNWEVIQHPIRCGSSSHCPLDMLCEPIAADLENWDSQCDGIHEDIKQKRLDCYRSCQGRSMDPQLCTIDEDDDWDASASAADEPQAELAST